MQQNLLGEAPQFLSVLDKVSKLAPIDRPVLIIGERGTGKELIAQRLHYLSKRWEQPLVSLNCSTLSEGLIDSELFGHESIVYNVGQMYNSDGLKAIGHQKGR